MHHYATMAVVATANNREQEPTASPPRSPQPDITATAAAALAVDDNQAAARQKNHIKEQRGTMVIVEVLASFIVLWSPFVFTGLLLLVGAIVESSALLNSLWWVFATLGLINEATNFIIYGAMNTGFKNAYRRLLCIGGTKVEHLGTMNRAYVNCKLFSILLKKGLPVYLVDLVTNWYL